MLFALGRDRVGTLSRNTLLCPNPNKGLPDLNRSEYVIKRKREGRYHEATAHIADYKLNSSLMPLQKGERISTLDTQTLECFKIMIVLSTPYGSSPVPQLSHRLFSAL